MMAKTVTSMLVGIATPQRFVRESVANSSLELRGAAAPPLKPALSL